MPDPDTRVWLLPNGNVVTARSANGYRELTGEVVVVGGELPADARPMVVLPEVKAWPDEGRVFVAAGEFRRALGDLSMSPEALRGQIERRKRELAEDLAFLALLEAEEAAAVSVPVQPECVPPHTGPDCSPDCENVAPGIPVTPESLEAHAEWLAECRPLAAEDLRGEAKRLRAEAEQAAAEQASVVECAVCPATKVWSGRVTPESPEPHAEPDSASTLPVTVGDRLREELTRRDWTQNEFADIIDRPVQVVSEIATGKKELTRKTAAQFAAALGLTPEFWLGAQNIHALARLRGDAEFQRGLDDIRKRAESAAARRKVLEDLKPGVYAVKRYDMMHKRMEDGGTVVVTPDGRYLVHDADSGLAEPVGLYESSWVENMTLLAEGDLSPVVSE